MKVLLLGNGGREHAIGWKFAQGDLLSNLISAPGNPGLARLGSTVNIDPTDSGEVVHLATESRVDLVVVGPEAPLATGVVDALTAASIPAFGPVQAGARLETSKTFAKAVMERAGVATAAAQTFAELDAAVEHLDSRAGPYVVKADGLAAGKGVVVTTDLEQARLWAKDCFSGRFGEAGRRVVVEDYLEGPEISIFGLCDGTDVIPLPPAQDYKRLEDRDKGPNTGGMGSFTPVDGFGVERVQAVVDSVIKPILRCLADDGTPYVGFIYAGLVLTPSGPKVLEFNCRLGDPETQVILPVLSSDLLSLIVACIEGSASAVNSRWSDQSAVNVVLASRGYPEAPVSGDEIAGLGTDSDETLIFHGGTRIEAGRTLTNGGRVLNVVGMGDDIPTARERAYARAGAISFAGKQYRKDIAQ